MTDDNEFAAWLLIILIVIVLLSVSGVVAW